ncbi:MAG: DUF4097 family beta strand repeat protein [Tenericutes bacterium]|nr:DUF4097 family beta strand repeat protein [Mycoplasmatota bacterium]
MGRMFKIALALFLIGVGVIAIFSVVTDENIFGRISDEDYEKVELLYDADEFDTLDVDFENRDIFVRESEDDQIKVVYYVTEKDSVTVTESGDTLKLLNEVDWYDQLFTWFNLVTNDDYYDIYIYVPLSQDYNFDLDTSNGNLDVVNLDNIKNFKFDSSNGRINISNVEADLIDVGTSNGTITVENTVVNGTVDLYSSNGRINLTNLTTDSQVIADISNGKIIATDIKCHSITLDTSNGDISLEIVGDKSDYEVYMSTSNGDLDYDGIGVTDEHFNLNGIYLVDLDSSNGDVSVVFID